MNTSAKKLLFYILFSVFFLLRGILPCIATTTMPANTPTEITEEILSNELVTIVLIGSVVDEKTLQPVGGVEVELLRTDDGQRQMFLTKKDGNFYFKLEPNKKYALTTINLKNAGAPKEISTDNITKSEIKRAILKIVSPVSAVAQSNQPAETPASTTFKVISSPPTAKPNMPPAEPIDVAPAVVKNSLVFKLQIGVFKQPLSAKSPFYTKAKEMFGSVETEKTPNGFTRYIVGDFTDVKKAREKEKQLRELGYEKAFVVSYKNQERLSPSMSPEDALKKYGSSLTTKGNQ